jgi:hypothetical protein
MTESRVREQLTPKRFMQYVVALWRYRCLEALCHLLRHVSIEAELVILDSPVEQALMCVAALVVLMQGVTADTELG